MDNWLLFFAIILATWRLSSLLISEDGPFNILIYFRILFSQIPTLGELISCIWCTSIWVGVGFSFMFTDGIKNIIVFALAFSAGAILIDKFLNYMTPTICNELYMVDDDVENE